MRFGRQPIFLRSENFFAELTPHERPRTHAVRGLFGMSFDIGSDTLTGVNDAAYKLPFILTA